MFQCQESSLIGIFVARLTFESFDAVHPGHATHKLAADGHNFIPLSQVAPGALGLGSRAVRGAALDEQPLNDLGGLAASLEAEAKAELVSRQTIDD